MALRPRTPKVRRYEPRFLAHPFELALAVMAILSAIRTGDILARYGSLPHVGLLAVPAWLLWVWVVIAGVGGCLMLAGLTWGTLRARARAIEAAGVWLTGAVWAVVAVADARFEPSQAWTWGQYAIIAVCSGIRLLALHRVERAITRAHQEADTSGEGR